MNIIFAVSKFIGGGSERYIIKKIEYIRQLYHNEKFDFIIITGGGGYEAVLKEKGIKHLVIPALSFGYDILPLKKKVEIIETISGYCNSIEFIPDIIELEDTTYTTELGIRLGRAFDIPFIANCLGEHNYRTKEDIKIVKQLEEAGTLYVLSDEYIRTMKNNMGYEPKRAKVMPLFVEKISTEINYKKENEKFTILTVSRLDFDKLYIKELIEQYAEASQSKKIINSKLIIVGDGELREEYEKQILRVNDKLIEFNNEIQLVGFVDNPMAYYAMCDVYIGMGTTLLQVAQFNKPAIMSSFYPNHKLSIGFYGDTKEINMGEWNDSYPKETFMNLVLSIYNNTELAQKYAALALKRVMDVHIIDKVMGMWIEIYKNVSHKNEFTIYNRHKSVKDRVKKILLHLINEEAYIKVKNKYLDIKNK